MTLMNAKELPEERLPLNPRVTSVQPLPQYQLLLEFSNGERKIFDASPYLHSGAFTQLRNPDTFNAVRVVFGSVEWPGEIDLSYDTVYLEGKPADELTLRTIA